MSKGAKITLIVVGAVGVAIAIWLIVRKMNRATEEQFYKIYKAMELAGIDIYQWNEISQGGKIIASFTKHLSKQEADRMLELVPKVSSGSAEEKELLELFNKSMKSYKK